MTIFKRDQLILCAIALGVVVIGYLAKLPGLWLFSPFVAVAGLLVIRLIRMMRRRT